MLKAWNFVKYKLCQSCFDNYLQKNFSTSIFESNTADTFDSCFNGQRMLRQLTDLNFKISTCCYRDIYPPAEVKFELNQASQIEVIVRIVNVFKLILLFLLFNSAILIHSRCLQGPITPSDLY